ncbi:helix-turn-helix domain-containing protein [Actinokineospora enzanensis]|uniref:helix-turn-helix domain-containing protein n=1 Tax=Actinokineospora enzanensis TaxID=155975 RepID=UPI00037640A7|nr:helix-turn-helix transcriptional regulator [Actinokineospora enzanensis]
MTLTRDPWVVRRLGGRRLRALREELDHTQQEVAAAMEWSLSKVLRIEAGTHGVSVTDVRALLGHYGITDPTQVDPHLEAARAGRGIPWYEPYRDVLTPSVRKVLGYESACARIRQVNPVHIPGPLQTAGYAREQLRPYFSDAQLDLAVEARVERRRRLVEDGGPELTVVIDESAIRRVVGGREVMREQLESLLARDARVRIRVIPFARGWHFGLEGAFILLDLADDPPMPRETVLYLEQADRDFFAGDDTDLVSDHERKWQQVLEPALSEAETRDLITEQLRILGES